MTDYTWSTKLHVAARLGRVSEARRLLLAGVDVDCRGGDGRSAVIRGSGCGNSGLVSLLVAVPAQLDIQDSIQDRTDCSALGVSEGPR